MDARPPLPAPPPRRPEIPPPLAGPAEVPSEDRPAAETPSRGPLVVGLLLVLALAGVVVAIGVWITRPSACEDANVLSERFGYCLTTPSGWRVASVEGAEVPFDELFKPESAATLTIQAVDTRRDLDTFVSDIREMQQEAGLDQGEVTETEVAGVRARQWDSRSTTDAGSFRVRDVVFVHEGVAWRVQFADAAEVFEQSARDLARMLGSWRFA